MLVVLLVCGKGSIVIVVVLLSLSLLLCPSHLINIVVVAIVTPAALKVDCYVFHGIGACCPPWLQQWQHCHHNINVRNLLRMHFLGVGGHFFTTEEHKLPALAT